MPVGPTHPLGKLSKLGLPMLEPYKKPAILWHDLVFTAPEIAYHERKGNFGKFGRTGNNFNVFVVDIDVKDGGLAKWDELCLENDPLCNHIVATPSGGYHYYYSYDARLDPIPNKAKIVIDGKLVGLDVRTNGGIIVMPGTTNGTVLYAMTKCEGEPAPVLVWLVKFLTPERKRKEESAPSKSKAHKTEPIQAPEGFP